MTRARHLLYLSLALLLMCSARGEEQTLAFPSGESLFAVDLVVQNNQIQEIFPDAPPGMIVFRFENGTGWAASQKYTDGWSTPDLVIRPLLGAYAVLPPGVSYTRTISGTAPAVIPVLYSGWHIISTKLLKPATGPAIVPDEANQIGVRQADGQIKVSYFSTWNSLNQWLPSMDFGDAPAVWYFFHETTTPANPAGSYPFSRRAVYFNNYVPALGIDSPFVSSGGCPVSGTAQFGTTSFSNQIDAVGPAVPLDSNGYIQRFVDAIRYVDQFFAYSSVKVEGSAQFITPPFSFQTSGFVPGPPSGLTGLITTNEGRAFVVQPGGYNPEPGEHVQLVARYNFLSRGYAVESLTEGSVCSNGVPIILPITYQWQRRAIGSLEWVDLPPATNDTLDVSSVRESDYGSYRLAARCGQAVEYSGSGYIFPHLFAKIADQTLATAVDGYLEVPLTVTAPNPEKVELTVWAPSTRTVGNGVYRVVQIWSGHGAAGHMTITVKATDGVITDTQSFEVDLVQVAALAQVPEFRPESFSFVVPVDKLSQFELPFDNPGTPLEKVKFSVDNPDPTRIELLEVALVNNKPVLNIRASGKASGKLSLDITASDGGFTSRQTFLLCFDSPMDDPPIVPPLGETRWGFPDISIDLVRLQFSDPDTPWNSFRYSVTSTHQVIKEAKFPPEMFTRMPDSAIFDLFPELVVERIPGAVGSDLVTISISDETSTVEQSFKYIVPDRNRAGQKISFKPIRSFRFGDVPVELEANSSAGLPVRFRVDGGPGKIQGNMLSATAGGSMFVSAYQDGDDQYLPANVYQTIVVGPADQFIEFPPGSAKLGGEPVQLQASASSGLPVRFELVSGPATLSGSILTPFHAGEVKVRAIQNGNVSYSPATVERTIAVAKTEQTITFPPLASIRFSSEPLRLPGQASSGLPLVFQVVSGPGRFSGSDFFGTDLGVVTIRATQPGNEDYEPGIPIEQIMLIERGTQSILFNPPSKIEYRFAPYPVNVVTTGGLPATLEVVSGPVTLTTDGLRFDATGIAVIRATQSGNQFYGPAEPVERTITITKAEQLISFSSLTNSVFSLVPRRLIATASSGLPVSFSVVSGLAIIDGDTIMATAPGTIIIRATQAGDARFRPAFEVFRTWTVLKVAQQIDFNPPRSVLLPRTNALLVAAASSGLPVKFQLIRGAASLTDNVLTFVSPGDIVIRAMQEGNSTYMPASPVEKTVTVMSAPQLSLRWSDSGAVLDWILSDDLTLETASALEGPWTEFSISQTGTNLVIPTAARSQFFRVRMR